MATPKLGLPELASAAANQTLANQTFDRLDQLVQMRVLDKDLATPPGSPADGAAYVVAAAATGAWAGKEGQIAYWRSSANAWSFLVPANGWLAWVDDEAKRYSREGGAWIAQASGAGGYAPVSSDAGTSITLSAGQAGGYLRTTAATAVTVTMPPQASVTWETDAEVHIEQAGAGAVTIAAGAGVTINRIATATATIAGQYGVVTLKRTAENVWTLFGALGAA